jgi:hypothetical protein
MATTTNYGWTTPDDTALVKDGAAAIRTLGSSVDSTVFANASAGIAKTIVDAKGDLIAATAADTVSRLAVGTNGTVLIADSAESTGMKWALPASGGMTLISTTTLTGATVTLSSIPASYVNLVLFFQNPVISTVNENLGLRFNGDTGSTYVIVSTPGLQAKVNGTGYAQLTGNMPNTGELGTIAVTLPNYANTVSPKQLTSESATTQGTVTTNWIMGRVFGVWNNTAAINSITIRPNTGNLTSGTVLLYGVK